MYFEKQYSPSDYPVQKVLCNQVPKHIICAFVNLFKKESVLLRGGFAYVIYSGNEKYVLKDFDMLAKIEDKCALITILQNSAKDVYLNQNKFGNFVITAFWEHNHLFFKLDILLQDELVDCNKVMWHEILVPCVSEEYLWYNSICKIAEKSVRLHDDEKTRKHIQMSLDMADIILRNKKKIDINVSLDAVKTKIQEASDIAKNLVDDEKYLKFVNVQNLFLSSWLNQK